MAFNEIRGSALRSFDQQRKKPLGLSAAAPKPSGYSLMSDAGSNNGVRSPGWSTGEIDYGAIGRERQASAEATQGWGRAAPAFTGSPNLDPNIVSNLARGPAAVGESRANVGNPNQQLTWTMGADGVGRWQDAKAAASAQRGLSAAAPAAKVNPVTKSAADLGESPYAGLKVDWGRVESNQNNELIQRTSEQRAAAQRAASMNASRRGLMAGGNSGIYQGMLGDIDQGTQESIARGQQSIATNIDNVSRDYDRGLAGAEAAWRMGVPSALASALMIPGSLQTQGLQNQGLMQGLEYGDRTMDSRVGVAQEAYTGARLGNDAAQFKIDEARAVAPEVREAAKLELARLRAMIREAEQKGNLELAGQLGQAAARVAEGGGWKIIGGVAGGLIGGLAGSVLPGAGTVAGGWGGAGIGMNAGAWIDQILGGG